MKTRSEYKGVWNELAATEHSALLHVAGYTDEASLRKSAGDAVDMLERQIGILPTDTFLEIGCGVGRVGKALAPRVARWIGCDVSESMLGHAARALAGQGNVDLVPISGHDLSPIPDASVDAVYCTVVFMHLEDWDRFNYVREAFRVLRPGGRFYCDNVNLDNEGGWQVFLSSLNIAPAKRAPWLSRCSTEPELRCYLERAGFGKISVGTADIWLVARGTKPPAAS